MVLCAISFVFGSIHILYGAPMFFLSLLLRRGVEVVVVSGSCRWLDIVCGSWRGRLARSIKTHNNKGCE